MEIEHGILIDIPVDISVIGSGPDLVNERSGVYFIVRSGACFSVRFEACFSARFGAYFSVRSEAYFIARPGVL